MVRLVLLGAPGSGKGTQAEAIARDLHIPHLSTGELLRAAVRDGSELGRRAERFMNDGHLVPDDLVLGIVEERLRAPDCRDGFLFDGFPRTVAQAEALDRFAPVDRVLAFEIPEGELLVRLTGRRSCPKCGTVYNLVTRPPREDERCDRDASPLVRRPDDEPAAARTRIEVYARQTAPLLDFYGRRGRMVRIDATGPPETVAARLRRATG